MNRKIIVYMFRLAGQLHYISSANKMVNIELERYRIVRG